MYAVGSLAAVWLVCWAGFVIAHDRQITPEKVFAYIHSVDFKHLSAEERKKFLLGLAERLNALTKDERDGSGLRDEWGSLFAEMTDGEKNLFLEATLPTNIKQMLVAFENLPDNQRKRTIESAMDRLRRPKKPSINSNGQTNRPPQLSPELQQKAETLGLKTFYSESSPETRAELAPLLEEIQNQMQHGRGLH